MNELTIHQIDYRYILIDNYKSMGLSEYDLAVILCVDNVLKSAPMLITAELLALKMNLGVKEIDTLLVSLTSRGFIEYRNVGENIVSSLKPTYDKLLNLFQSDVVRLIEGNIDQKRKEELSNIFVIVQKELGRNLSPIEIEKIREWISQGITEEIIVECIHECQHKMKNVTINKLDKMILKYVSSRDIEREGYSSANEKWKKDLEKTIEIANTRWTDDE